MTNKDRENFQYNGGDLVYIISPLTRQLRTNSVLDGIILKGMLEYKRLKPTVIRTNHGNIQNLAELRQIMNTDLKFN